MSVIGRNRVPLLLSDIISMNTQELKDVRDPIYYNNVRVVWPPDWNGTDELTFTLDNGETVDVFIYGDTQTTGDGDEQFNNMEIAIPIDGYKELNKSSRTDDLIGMGGKRKSSSKRRKRRKTRKSRKKRMSRKHRK